LAEEVALLDMLSGGGSTGVPPRLRPFRVQRLRRAAEESAERFREAVEIVLKAWTQERFSFKAHTSISTASRCCPSLAAAASPTGWRDVGVRHRLGGEPRLFHPDGSALLLKELATRSALCAKLAEAGFSDQAAISRWRAGRLARPQARPRPSPARRAVVGRFYAGRNTPSQVDAAYLRRQGSTQHYVDSIILHGTPGSVVEQIGRLKEEIGLNY